MVSGSISLPSRGAFHRSLTVLFAIGHMVVFSLRRWSSRIPSGFLVSRRTLDTPSLQSDSRTGISPSLSCFSKTVLLLILVPSGVRYPAHIAICGLGSSDFARHYFRNRFSFFSSRYLDVSVPWVPFVRLWIHLTIQRHYPLWVPSFGNLRITVYVQLPAAYRSLSRPSSAPCTKASASTLFVA